MNDKSDKRDETARQTETGRTNGSKPAANAFVMLARTAAMDVPPQRNAARFNYTKELHEGTARC